MLQPADDICFSLWSKELRDRAHESQLRVFIGLDGCLSSASEQQQQLRVSEALRGVANFLSFTSLNSRARRENRLPLPRLGPLVGSCWHHIGASAAAAAAAPAAAAAAAAAGLSRLLQRSERLLNPKISDGSAPFQTASRRAPPPPPARH